MEGCSLATMSQEINGIKDKLNGMEKKLDSLLVALEGNSYDPDSGYLKKIKTLEKENVDLKSEIESIKTSLNDYILKAKWFALGLAAIGSGTIYQIIQLVFK